MYTEKQISIYYYLLLMISVTIYYSSFTIDLSSFNLQVPQIFLFILIFIYLINSLYQKKIVILNDKILYILIFCLLLLFSVSTLSAKNVFISFKGLFKWFSGFFLMLIIPIIIQNDYQFRKIFNYLVFSGNLFMLIILVKVNMVGVIPQHGIDFFNYNPNQLGQYSVSLLMLNISCLFAKNMKYKITAMFFVIINTIILVLTFSKASWLAGLISLIIFSLLYIYKQHKISKKIILTFSLLVMTFILFWIGKNFFLKYLSSRIDRLLLVLKNPLSSKTMRVRYKIWENCWQIGKNNFWGVGLYNIGYYLNFNHAHNIFFNILGISGFPGLFMFILFIIYLFKKIIKITLKRCKMYSYRLGLFASASAYFIANNSSDSFGAETHLIFWITTGLLLYGSKKVICYFK